LQGYGGQSGLPPGVSFFVSRDQGTTWTSRPANSPFGQVEQIITDATGTLYVLDTVVGISKSRDAGVTWTTQNAGLPSHATVSMLALDPTDPAILYAAVSSRGLYRSTDAAATWQKLPFPPSDAQQVVVAPSDPQLLYVGGPGLWKSTDGGGSWQAVPGLPQIITALAIDPRSPQLVAVGAYDSSHQPDLWLSADGGASWHSGGLKQRVETIVFAMSQPETLAVALFVDNPASTSEVDVRVSHDRGATWVDFGSPVTTIPATRVAVHAAPLLIAGDRLLLGTVDGVWQQPFPPKVAHDARYFAATGYRVDHDAIWNYFQARGGVATFGYPVSRPFTLLGFPVQIFQRAVLQVWPDGSVHPLNLLDPDVLPVTSVNFSTFPAHDPVLAASAPPPATPSYGQAVQQYLQTQVPNVWNGHPVHFLATYLQAAPQDAGSPGPLLALEVWGFPTSRPMRDPHNANFIYQRFQRGILHYDASTGVTRGILLGDAFKDVLLGQGPADLQAQLQGSRFFQQYCPDQPLGLCRPAAVPGSDLRYAFEPQ
jgi:hypothetical protein